MNPILLNILQTAFGKSGNNQTQQLRADINSPIPQNNVVPHPQDFSMVENALIGALKGSPSNNTQQPQQQQNPLQAAIQGPQQAQAAGTPTPTPTPQTESYPNGATDYEKQAAAIFNKYGVPPAVGLGIYAMEGRGNTINPNNPYNIGAYDWNPQNANAYDFKDPMQGTQAAAQFLAGQSPYMAPDKAKIFQDALNAYKKSGDQTAYLKAIAPTYSSNPQYAQTIMQTPEYNRWSYNGQ